MRLAVDAMGGDRAPEAIVPGAVEVAREQPELELLLVGDEARVRAAAGPGDWPANLRTVAAAEVIGMDESPVEALRRKRDASIAVATRLVKAGEAQAVISAGHTGAAVAAATLFLRPLAGIKRAGIAAVIPTRAGATVLIDVGANIQCQPLHLYHYGLMGAEFARRVLGVAAPRVGLLSIGEEAHKGTDLVRRTHEHFRASPLCFHGNVEGNDIFRGAADVVVCDGFAGNLVLKAAEGVGEGVLGLIKDVVQQQAAAGTLKIEELLPVFAELKRRLDYSEHGGAPLLGVQGLAMICHGRSDARAFANALRMTVRMVAADLVGAIAQGIAAHGHLDADEEG